MLFILLALQASIKSTVIACEKSGRRARLRGSTGGFAASAMKKKRAHHETKNRNPRLCRRPEDRAREGGTGQGHARRTGENRAQTHVESERENDGESLSRFHHAANKKAGVYPCLFAIKITIKNIYITTLHFSRDRK